MNRLDGKYRWLTRYLGLIAGGLAAVGILAAVCAPLKYPFTNDSTGYIQEADNLIAGRGLVRTSIRWAASDLEPSKFFPPGYAVLIAAGPAIGVATPDMALLVARLSWALLPAAFFFALAPLIGAAPAVACSALVLLSPGVYEYGYTAMSDVPFLLLAILCFGFLVRGLSPGAGRHLLFISGLCAGAAYATRNAGLAIHAAVIGAFVLAALTRIASMRELAGKLALWIGSSALVLVPLFWRNLVAFRNLQPFSAPPADFGLVVSARKFLEGFLLDLSGVPAVAKLAWDYKMLLAIGGPLLIMLALGLRRAFAQRLAAQRITILALACYLFAGSAMITLSQALYGTMGDLRYAMQYTWSFAALGAIALSGQRAASWSKAALGAALILLVAGRLMYIREDLAKEAALARLFEREKSFVQAMRQIPDSRWIATNRIKFELARDAELRDAVAALPQDAFIASNLGFFLQHLVRPRIVRELEWDDLNDFQALRVIDQAAAEVSPQRPIYFVVLPTNRMLKSAQAAAWHEVVIAGTSPQFTLFRQRANFLILRYQVEPPRPARAASSDP